MSMFDSFLKKRKESKQKDRHQQFFRGIVLAMDAAVAGGQFTGDPSNPYGFNEDVRQFETTITHAWAHQIADLLRISEEAGKSETEMVPILASFCATCLSQLTADLMSVAKSHPDQEIGKEMLESLNQFLVDSHHIDIQEKIV